MNRPRAGHGDNAGGNRKTILSLIRERPMIFRKDVSSLSGLSISTTKRLIDELLAEDSLEEARGEDPERRRGPKAGSLRLNEKHACAIGLNIEPSRIEGCVVSLTGRIRRRQQFPLASSGSEAAIGQCVQIVDSFRNSVAADCGGRFIGVGVAIAGLVDARRGLIYDCFPIPGWENVALQERLEGELGLPVLVDDRVRSMAVGEKRYGVARDLETFLYVDIGSGVGSCFFLDNRIYRGKNGISGEFGHIRVKENGPQCNCGNKGCLEVLVSTGSILAAVRSSVQSNVYTQLKDGLEAGRSISLPDVAGAAAEGDKLASLLVVETAELIGIGLADLVSVFDPGTIILAGEVVRGLGELLVDGIVRTVRLRGIHPITRRTQFLTASEIPHMGAWGAATLPLEQWFGSGILNL